MLFIINFRKGWVGRVLAHATKPTVVSQLRHRRSKKQNRPTNAERSEEP